MLWWLSNTSGHEGFWASFCEVGVLKILARKRMQHLDFAYSLPLHYSVWLCETWPTLIVPETAFFFSHDMAAIDSPSSCNSLKNLLRIEWQRFFVTKALQNLTSNSVNVLRGFWGNKSWTCLLFPHLLIALKCSVQPSPFGSNPEDLAYFRIGLPHPVGERSSTLSHRWSCFENHWHYLVMTITNVQIEAGFFDRMPHAFAKHPGWSLIVECSGDLHFDDRHALKDVGASLYLTFHEASGQGKGVKRLHQAWQNTTHMTD